MTLSNLSNNQKRRRKSATRLFTVQALFQMEVGGQSVDKVMQEFEDHRFGAIYDDIEYEEGDRTFFRALMEAVVENQAKIDQMTDRALVAKWPLARIDSTLRALFRAAGAELVLGETPPKVVITEFVDVAKAFYPESDEPKFSNAVMDHMAHEARPDAF